MLLKHPVARSTASIVSAGKDRLAVGATIDHGQCRLLGLLRRQHRTDLGLNPGIDHEPDQVIHLPEGDDK